VRRIVTLGPLLGLLVLAQPAQPVVGAPDESLTLAVLRRDGVVIPFAYFNARRRALLERGRWENPWPVPGKDFEVPLQLSDVPRDWWPGGRAISAWTAWPSQGAKTEVQSVAPVALVAHCQLGLGIRTSYRSAEPAPPETAQPYPKDGLATIGDVTVERPLILQASAPEWQAVRETVDRQVAELEDNAVRREAGGWSNPPPPDERRETAFTPEVIMRVTPRALYFEGVKTYGPAAPAVRRGSEQVPNRCNLLTYAAGWVLLSKDGAPKVQAAAEVTDCNREGLVYSLPLGLIPRGDRVLWVVQVSGWGYERYEVMEVREDRVRSLIATPGGWCPGM
jgi:hypothetical protein